MSQWLNLACHELGQVITMPAAAGETVKPGPFRIGQIRGILPGILLARCPRGTAFGGICRKTRAFWHRPLVPLAVRA
jgi:hypothetical protein